MIKFVIGANATFTIVSNLFHNEISSHEHTGCLLAVFLFILQFHPNLCTQKLLMS